MHKTFLFLIFITIYITIKGEAGETISGRNIGFANSSVTKSGVFSVFGNQAGLVDVEEVSVGVHSERYYLLKELSLHHLVFVLPTNSGVFGFGMNCFGYKYYHENEIVIGFSKKFSGSFSASVQLDYLSKTIYNYCNKKFFTFELGLITEISDKLLLGAHIFNPISASSVDGKDVNLPAILRIGSAYKISDKILVSTEIKKEINQKHVIIYGLEYSLNEFASLRCGIASNPIRMSFGIGWFINGVSIDASTTYHPILGYTPSISIIKGFKKQSES